MRPVPPFLFWPKPSNVCRKEGANSKLGPNMPQPSDDVVGEMSILRVYYSIMNAGLKEIWALHVMHVDIGVTHGLHTLRDEFCHKFPS